MYLRWNKINFDTLHQIEKDKNHFVLATLKVFSILFYQEVLQISIPVR